MNQRIYDSDYNIDENAEGLVIERYQAIPHNFIENLKQERFDNKSRGAGEYHRAASIPVAVVDKWKAEGRDFDNAKVSEILGWLRAEGLDYFITTDKV